MARGQRICIACGTGYHYCPQCTEDRDKPTWMFAWHDIECRTVWDIICKYKNGYITKDEAVEKLNKTITNKIKFTPDIEADIKAICQVEEKPQAQKETLDKNNVPRKNKK